MLNEAQKRVLGKGFALAMAFAFGFLPWELAAASPTKPSDAPAVETATVTLPMMTISARTKHSKRTRYVPAQAQLTIKNKMLKDKVCSWVPRINDALSLHFSRHPVFPSTKKNVKASAKTEKRLLRTIRKATGGSWLKGLKFEYGKLNPRSIDPKTLCKAKKA